MCRYNPDDDFIQGKVERGQRPPRRRRRPEEQLAVHLAENFGATVDPEALRKFIAENWTTLSRLAHEIHADAVRRAHWGKQCSSI